MIRHRVSEVLMEARDAEPLARTSAMFRRILDAVTHAERAGVDPLPVLAGGLAAVCSNNERMMTLLIELEQKIVRPIIIQTPLILKREEGT